MRLAVPQIARFFILFWGAVFLGWGLTKLKIFFKITKIAGRELEADPHAYLCHILYFAMFVDEIGVGAESPA